MEKTVQSTPSENASQSNWLRQFVSPTKSMTGQISRALLASVVAAAVDFGVLVLLKEFADLRAETAAIPGYLVGGVVNYFLCARWVFPSAPASVTIGFTYFTILSLGGLGLTWLCIHFLNGVWGVHYTLAKVVALGFAFGWNFFSRKLFLFRS